MLSVGTAAAPSGDTPALSGQLTPSKLRKREAKAPVLWKPAEEPLPNTPVVMVTGSDSVRVGFGGNFTFSRQIPSMIGKQKPVAGAVAAERKEGEWEVVPVFVADDAAAKASTLDITYPIRNGIITDWVRAAI